MRMSVDDEDEDEDEHHQASQLCECGVVQPRYTSVSNEKDE